MTARHFQPILPQIEVSTIETGWEIGELEKSIRQSPRTYALPGVGFVLESMLADGGELYTDLAGEKLYLRDRNAVAFFPRETTPGKVIASTRHFLASSTNGLRYITDDYDVYEGDFTNLPADLLKPTQGRDLRYL